MNKNIIFKRILMVVLTILMILLELSFWPGYLVHDYITNKSDSSYGSNGFAVTAETSITQYFIPQMKWLGSVDIVAAFNEEIVGDEKLNFTIYSETGKEIFNREIPISEMEDGIYYTIPVKKKLKVGEQYHWTIESTTELPYDWQLILSEDKTGIAPENTFLEVNGIQNIGEEAQTVSQYSYYIHKDKVVIIATCWCGTFLVYLICLEALQKIFNRVLNEEKAVEKEETNHDI